MQRPKKCPLCDSKPRMIYSLQSERGLNGLPEYWVYYGCNTCLEYSKATSPISEDQAISEAIKQWNRKVRYISKRVEHMDGGQ